MELNELYTVCAFCEKRDVHFTPTKVIFYGSFLQINVTNQSGLFFRVATVTVYNVGKGGNSTLFNTHRSGKLMQSSCYI